MSALSLLMLLMMSLKGTGTKQVPLLAHRHRPHVPVSALPYVAPEHLPSALLDTGFSALIWGSAAIQARLVTSFFALGLDVSLHNCYTLGS